MADELVLTRCCDCIQSFSITSGKPREFADFDTDSGKPLRRHFCEICGSGLYATTPMVDNIVSVFSGSIDNSEEWWAPNKGTADLLKGNASGANFDCPEQYIESKNHFFPDFPVKPKEGIPERHPRGPLDIDH